MRQVDGSVRWICPNRDCSWSVVATRSEEPGNAPHCMCGALMEKGEEIPVLSYLDFLRGETPEE